MKKKPFERQKAGIPDPKAVSYYHNRTFQSVCHHYGAKAGETIFQEAFERYKNNQEQFPASPWSRNSWWRMLAAKIVSDNLMTAQNFVTNRTLS